MQSTTAVTLNVLNQNPVSIPPATRNLVEESIVIAKQTFIDGMVIYQKLIDDIEKHPILKGVYRYYHNPQPRDDNFLYYNANQIVGTQLVAAEGPQSKEQVAALIQETLYNKKMPIKRIIAFGSCIGSKHHPKLKPNQDFFDYCTGENSTKVFGDYHVTYKRLSGEVKANPSMGYCYLHDIVQSQLQVYKSEASGLKVVNQLFVTIYPLEDMCTIALNEKSFTADAAQANVAFERRKKILWDVYQESLKSPLLIHCAAGVGRTGHLIFMFEIMREYEKIFASDNVVTIAAEINKVLARIRENRPALVCSLDQFVMAIRNAVILRQYGLEQELLQKMAANVSVVAAKSAEVGPTKILLPPIATEISLDKKEMELAKPPEIVETVVGRFTVRDYK